MSIYGVAELARAIGIAPSLMAQWLRRGKVPEPSARLACGPVWLDDPAVSEWIEAHTQPHIDA